MAVAYMTGVQIPQYKVLTDFGAWEYKDELTAPANGDSVIIPTTVKSVAVTLEVSAGTGKVQATTSLLSEVENDTAVWVDWDAGEVAVTTQDGVAPVTAIRQVNATGTTRFIVRAQ